MEIKLLHMPIAPSDEWSLSKNLIHISTNNVDITFSAHNTSLNQSV
jgi:hypothetical protein